jgi:flagellar biosynthesis/type III secretory pathway protein FliH
MKRINFKKTLAVMLFAIVAVLGLTDVTSAQWRSRDAREQERIYRQQQKIQRQQDKYDRQRQRAYNDRYRVYRNGSYYSTDSRGAELLRAAVNRGYQQGYYAGRQDRLNRSGSSYYYNSDIYRGGNYGYESYVDASQYRYYFQQGFQRGYQDGYYSRNQYGYSSNGTFNILGNILSGILNIRSY